MAKKKERRRQVIPKDESKSDRFVRVVSPRVDKAVKAIEQIAFCAGSTYESTSKQQQDIKIALNDAVRSVTAAFEQKPEAQQGFKFTS